MKYTKGRELTLGEALRAMLDGGCVIDRDGLFRFHEDQFQIFSEARGWNEWGGTICNETPLFEAIPVNEVDEFAELDRMSNEFTLNLHPTIGDLNEFRKQFARAILDICERRYQHKEDPK